MGRHREGAAEPRAKILHFARCGDRNIANRDVNDINLRQLLTITDYLKLRFVVIDLEFVDEEPGSD